jgi:hypothetical protein
MRARGWHKFSPAPAGSPPAGDAPAVLTAREMADALRMSVETFTRRWAWRFTDRRPLDARGKGSPRKFLRGELELFLHHGVEALANHRRKGR